MPRRIAIQVRNGVISNWRNNWQLDSPATLDSMSTKHIGPSYNRNVDSRKNTSFQPVARRTGFADINSALRMTEHWWVKVAEETEVAAVSGDSERLFKFMRDTGEINFRNYARTVFPEFSVHTESTRRSSAKCLKVVSVPLIFKTPNSG